MARLPRLIVPYQPHHVIQRGAGRQPVFHDDDDYLIFLKYLKDASRQFKVAIHAYVLMPNHLHLLASPADQTGLARMMQWIGRFYVPYFNHKYERVGTLWQGRYKAAVVDSERYFLLCSRYIELNPVRAGLAAQPEHYRWSSYLHHAGTKPDPLVSEHALLWALGNTPFAREAAYRALVEEAIPDHEVRVLTDATLKGWAIGSEQFKVALEKQSHQRVRPARRGRPPRSISAAPQPAPVTQP
ncbi:MAG: transposase [Herminiimonas sp.]|nr:transposase [Herminiimonas sp.]